MKKNNIYIVFLFISISLLLVSCTSSQTGNESHGSKNDQKQEIEKQVNEIRADLINRYDPIIFPLKDFSNRKVYTYTLQQLLVNETGRYVLFEGNLDDITKENDIFFAHFTSRLSEEFLDDRNIKYHLKTSYDNIKFLIENPPKHDYMTTFLLSWGLQKDFFVVCAISNVNKIVTYSVRGSSFEGSEEVELEIESPDKFSATGKLIELIPYPVVIEKQRRP